MAESTMPLYPPPGPPETGRVIQFFAPEGVIDLGWGHPEPPLLAVDLVREAAARAIERHGPDALTYGAAEGPSPLIGWLRERLGRIDGRTPGPGEVLVTAGASQGLDLVCTMLTRPGDICLAPVPTYHLALKIMHEHPVEVRPVVSDAEGVLPEAVAEATEQARREGRRVALLYLVPTFGNPTGITLPLERRQALADLAAESGVRIVEDDVYRELSYGPPVPPSIWSLSAPGSVIRLGSFSKTLAPGLRLGWLTADAATVRRLADGGLLDSGGGIAHLPALVVAELAASGAYEANLASLRQALAARRDALLGALEHELPGGLTSPPGGGYFCWLRLPEGLDATALLPLAERQGVSYLPGATFTLGADRERETLRLCFARYPPGLLVEAGCRLRLAVEAGLQGKTVVPA